MYKHLISDHQRSERGDFLRERRRRCPGIGQVLVAVPRARDTSVNDLAFSKRPVLVPAYVGDGRDAAIVFEYCYSLAPARNDTCTLFRNALDAANRHVS